MHEKEFYALYSSPGIIRVFRSRRLRWAGYVARMGRGAYIILVGKLREGEHLEDSGVDGRIILKCILGDWDGDYGLDRSGSV